MFDSLIPFENRLFHPFQGQNRQNLWNGQWMSNMSPKLDIIRHEKATIVQAELPGFKKEDVHIELSDDGRHLTISGENKRDKSYKDGDITYSERSYGSFSRTVSLPFNSNPEGVKAKFIDGILEITVPKEESKINKRAINID